MSRWPFPATALTAMVAALLTAIPAIAAADHRRAGLAQRHHDDRRQTTPAPDPKFGGVIKEDAPQSKPWWAPRIVPPKGAPNVLLIITDDSGFGVPSTFGGVIPTPAMDRVAKNGLRYNNIHSTALCSPTRAALITGRNHHSVGFGVISEQSTGFPGYNSIIAQGQGHHRPHPQGQRLRHLVVRQESQHARPSRPARSGRSTSGRSAWASSISTASSAATRTSGSRISSATPPRSIPSRASRAGT